MIQELSVHGSNTAHPRRRVWKGAGALMVALGLASLTAAPAMAQPWSVVPYSHNDATLQGSGGPASNSVGYPSAANRLGRLTTKDIVPQGSAQATPPQWQVVDPG